MAAIGLVMDPEVDESLFHWTLCGVPSFDASVGGWSGSCTRVGCMPTAPTALFSTVVHTWVWIVFQLSLQSCAQS